MLSTSDTSSCYAVCSNADGQTLIIINILFSLMRILIIIKVGIKENRIFRYTTDSVSIPVAVNPMLYFIISVFLSISCCLAVNLSLKQTALIFI